MPSLRALIACVAATAAMPALACEPCPSKLSLDQTIERASLVVVARNMDRDTMTTMEARSGPEAIQVNVERILKGETYEKIKVRSWYGSCNYGAKMPQGSRAILLLQEETDLTTGAVKDGEYKPVESGCSTSQLEVKGGQVRLGQNWISVDDFKQKYIVK